MENGGGGVATFPSNLHELLPHYSGFDMKRLVKSREKVGGREGGGGRVGQRKRWP